MYCYVHTNPKIILSESGAFMSGQSGFVIVKLAQIICCNHFYIFCDFLPILVIKIF